MEKLIFKFVKKLYSPQFIIAVFLSFIFIGIVPLIRSIMPQTVFLVYSVLVLSPIAIYLSSNFILLIVTMPKVFTKIKILATINDPKITVKQLARRMNISPIKAFVLLELSERTGHYKRNKLEYTIVTR